MGTNPAVVAAVASVFLSWYEFFVRDNKALGLFVGLWAPTIFAFAGYFNQSRMGQSLRNLT